MLQSNIEQTASGSGTGTFQLVGPSDALRVSFVAGVGSGNPIYYRAEQTPAWEEGWGIATAGSPDTLTRNPIRSSNGNALVNFPVGTKRVYGVLLPDAFRFGGGLSLPTAGGSANARTIAYAPACRLLRPGMVFRFLNGAAANTGPATLQVDALTAAPIIAGGSPLAAGEMPAGALVSVLFDGTSFHLDRPAWPAAGQIVWHAASTPPTGTIKANGAALSRTSFARLFAAIGTTYGAGDGSTTFNVPDLRGEFARGWDDGRGVDAGRAIGTAQADEFRSHTHGGALSTAFDSFGYAGGGSVFIRAVRNVSDATGGAETRPRNVALLACITF